MGGHRWVVDPDFGGRLFRLARWVRWLFLRKHPLVGSFLMVQGRRVRIVAVDKDTVTFEETHFDERKVKDV